MVSFALDLLKIYQRRKGKPTEGCVVDGVSCSERFGRSIEQGVPLTTAIKMTCQGCAGLNHTSESRALFNLFLGTASVLAIGVAFGECGGEHSAWGGYSQHLDQQGESWMIHSKTGSFIEHVDSNSFNEPCKPNKS